jgi:endonuclease/exonuclease/phosphatase (EEP) superfamily protein YafD
VRGAWNYGIAAAILLLGVATVLAGSDHWLPALLGHFRLHMADTALVLALAVAVTRFRMPVRMGLCFSALGVWVFNTNFVDEAMPRAGLPANSGESIVLRVAFANVLASNDDYDLMVAWVRSERVDLLVASEITDRWLNALEALREELSHGHNARYGDLAILSRRPMERPTENLSVRFARAAAAEIGTPVGPVTIVSAHPTVPLGAERTAIRDRALARLGARAVEAQGGVIVAGDFNATPWSPPFRAMVREAGLAFGGGARRKTWPVWPNWPMWLALPIDHVLAGRGCVVIDLRHGPDVGSDHLPVIAEIRCFARVSAP